MNSESFDKMLDRFHDLGNEKFSTFSKFHSFESDSVLLRKTIQSSALLLRKTKQMNSPFRPNKMIKKSKILDNRQRMQIRRQFNKKLYKKLKNQQIMQSAPINN